jgi:hypothetical protein
MERRVGRWDDLAIEIRSLERAMTLQISQVAPDLAQAPSDGDKRPFNRLAAARRRPLDHSRDSVPPTAAVPAGADPTLEAPAGTWGY